MARKTIETSRYYQDVVKVMTSQGLLLGSYDAAGKANVMTIGWGALGSIWGIPVWIVLVRPSRYTYECIERSGCFSVNVPTPAMAKACTICGTRSGRDGDKCAPAGLTVTRGSHVPAPLADQCPIVYECKVVHYNDVAPDTLATEIIAGAYPAGDFHRVYFGQVLSAAAGDVSALG